MRSVPKALRLLLIGSVGLATSPGPSFAGNVFQDMWGVVTDPLKLSQSSKTLADTTANVMIQLEDLEGVTNGHVAERLEQVRSILKDAINGTDAEIQKAVSAMNDLEAQVNNDANNLIYNAQCVVDVTLLNTAQQSFAGLISTLSKADPAINLLGIKLIDVSTNQVQIDTPDDAYRSTKQAAMKALEKATTDNSNAFDILSTYQNLEAAAKFTRCYYKNSSEELIFTHEVNDLERLSLPWVTVVHPDINYRP